jgi:hypothetical protein
MAAGWQCDGTYFSEKRSLGGIANEKKRKKIPMVAER